MRIRAFAILAVAAFVPGTTVAQEQALRNLRILLIADGPMREFQFVRESLVREAKKNGKELAVYVQSKDAEAMQKPVEGLRILQELPDQASVEGEKKGPSFSDYDVIIAFDPNWTKLSAKQHTALKDWVSKHAGGFITVAGQVNIYQKGRDLDDVMKIVPVVVLDTRLHGIGLQNGQQKDQRYTLKFAPKAKFKLDPDGEGPAAGWDKFFWDEKKQVVKGKETKSERGFYFCCPVARIKDGAEVIATFEPETVFLGETPKSYPFLVGGRYGEGKTLFLASPETWRLRAYREEYFVQCWRTLTHHVASDKKAAPKE